MKENDLEIAELLKEEALAMEKKYKISHTDALKRLSDAFSSDHDLQQAFSSASSIKQFKKNALYKAFIKKTREHVYYSLRQYFTQDVSLGDLIEEYKVRDVSEKILALHASTRERALYVDEFIQTILEITKDDNKIVDIGAGVFPLAMPLAQLGYKKYLAIENQKDSVEILELYKKHAPENVFEILNGSIDDVVWSEYLKEKELFDTAIMLKLVSVVKRHNEEEFALLAKTPAKKYLVSIPKTSMTKNEDISRREIAIVHEFAELAGKKISDTFDFPDEILFMIK